MHFIEKRGCAENQGAGTGHRTRDPLRLTESVLLPELRGARPIQMSLVLLC